MPTTASLLALARKKLLEEGDEILDDATLLIYANFAYQDIVKRAFPNNSIKTATVHFTAGLSTDLPTDFGTLYSDPAKDAYSIFPELSIGDFARLTGGQGITYQGGVLKVYPTDTPLLTIRYYPSYEDLALSPAQDPTIDSYFHELILYGTLARAFEDLQDEELATFYDGKYEKKLAQKIANYSLYEEGNQRGGVMFNEIPIISESGGGLSSSTTQM